MAHSEFSPSRVWKDLRVWMVWQEPSRRGHFRWRKEGGNSFERPRTSNHRRASSILCLVVKEVFLGGRSTIQSWNRSGRLCLGTTCTEIKSIKPHMSKKLWAKIYLRRCDAYPRSLTTFCLPHTIESCRVGTWRSIRDPTTRRCFTGSTIPLGMSVCWFIATIGDFFALKLCWCFDFVTSSKALLRTLRGESRDMRMRTWPLLPREGVARAMGDMTSSWRRLMLLLRPDRGRRSCESRGNPTFLIENIFNLNANLWPGEILQKK